MNLNRIQLLLAIAAGITTIARGADEPIGHRPPPPVMTALDADGNGALSPEEIAGSSAALADLDENADGALTRDELFPPRPEESEKADQPEGPPPGKRPAPPLIAALDADHDGTISAGEIANAPEALKTLDKNSDGDLSGKELHPKRPRPPKNEGEDGAGGPPPEGSRHGRPPGPPRGAGGR